MGKDLAEAFPSVKALFDQAVESFGRVDLLFNNAGINVPAVPLDELSVADLRRIIDTNLTGSFLCAREAIKRMSKKHGGAGGAIVNLSSIAARLGGPGEYVDYAAAKGAIDTFTIGLAKELGPDGIRVNAVRPGIINTEIHASSGDPARLGRIGAMAPVGRYGEPEEIARAILWLLSDEASYTTGALLDVAGGR